MGEARLVFCVKSARITCNKAKNSIFEGDDQSVTQKPISETILAKRLAVTERLLEFIMDGNIWPEIVSLLAELEAIDPDFNEVVSKVDLAAQMSEQVHKNPDIDLARDLGILVVGVDAAQSVVEAPESGREYLGGHFVSDNRGIGWIVIVKDGYVNKMPAYKIDATAAVDLPVLPEIKAGMKNGRLKNLIIIQEFKNFGEARATIRDLYHLTEREVDVCEHLLEGQNAAVMAGEMNVSRETIKTHFKNIYQKTGVRSQIDLVRILTQLCSVSAVLNFNKKTSVGSSVYLNQTSISLQSEFCETRYGTKLCYSVCGDPNGRPVIKFHSPLGSRTHWEGMVKGAQKFGVKLYCFDRPGYGNSDPVPIYGAKSIAACVDDLLTANSLNSADMIAFGIGGRIMLDAYPYIQSKVSNMYFYSLSAPDDKSKKEKYLANSSRKQNLTTFQKLNKLLATQPHTVAATWRIFSRVKSEAVMAKIVRTAYKKSPVDTALLSNPDFFRFMCRNGLIALEQGGDSQAYEFLNCKKPFAHSYDLFSKVNLTALFGQEDKNNSLQDAQNFMRHFPNQKCIEVPQKGQLYILGDFSGFLGEIYEV